MLRLWPDPKKWPAYLMLVAESDSFLRRKKTRVLVSKHRGNIFIQTNQPMYRQAETGNISKRLDKSEVILHGLNINSDLYSSSERLL